MNDTFLSISLFIHLVATVVWMGGLVIFTFYVWPEAKRSITNPEESRYMVMVLQKRFRPLANLSLVFLLGTGMIQVGADENYEGILTFTNTWTMAMLFKHLAFGGMVVVAGILQFGIAPAIERAMLLAKRGETAALDRLLEREIRFTQVMLGLGVLVLIFTAIATAL